MDLVLDGKEEMSDEKKEKFEKFKVEVERQEQAELEDERGSITITRNCCNIVMV